MESNVLQADCAESIENYAKKSVEYGSKCLFSGEHGWQGNAFLTYETANAKDKKGNKIYNLKYRHSAEAYWVKDRHLKDKTNCHICLVAKNDEGRKDINFALSLANGDENNSDGSFYYKPRLDLELLLNIPKDNVIVTSACIAGWKYDDAEEIWLKIHEHFKDNFFFEIQAHNTEPQKRLNKKIIDLSDKYGIDIICGLDSHYVDDKNSIKRDQILKYKNIHYEDEDGWYLDFPDGKETLNRLLKQGVLTLEQSLRAIMNTNVFVNECDEIVFDRSFKIPCVYPNTTFDERVDIYKNILNERYKKEKLKSKEKIEGIQWEARQVIESKVVDYFLTNDKIVQKAVNEYNGILTTTSRGSSASFVTNKLLGFTTIDRFNAEIPIYPERFLTKDRVLSGQMPDIDYNVASQEPFVKASRDLLGEHGCYPLMAIEKLKEKASWQLYAGANEIEFETANEISKALDKYNEKLKYASDDDKEYILVEDYIPKQYIDTYKESLEYQGITINAKAHACGFLILNGDIRREIGLIRMTSESTGKSTLCVAMEGSYLDSFGYVKNDFLIVDSVALTYEFFKSINREVPSFDELREMIKDDKPTWDIYAKGITCCINQCEKESTTKKCMQYKMTNLAESSAFIAGIRPGFRSLINNFLKRIPYTTGVEKLDELLEDSYRYLLYQESIMKLLSYLGIPMTRCYETIKKISKKKFSQAQLDDLKDSLKKGWIEKIGDTSKFESIWETVDNFAKYGFNSPHSLSMGGDSAYEAWFKAHHTSKFYEVAINHYQAKNKKDKIEDLTKEAIKFFGYKMGEYKFGNDNRQVTIDDTTKVIYPSLSNLKGMGRNVAEELYNISANNKFDTFYALLKYLFPKSKNKTLAENTETMDSGYKTSIDSGMLDTLIRLDYFKDFGKSNKLLRFVGLYNMFEGKKAPKKATVAKNITDINILQLIEQCSTPTEATYTKFESEKFLNFVWDYIPNKNVSLQEKLTFQNEKLGYIDYTNAVLPKKYVLITDVNTTYSPVVETYSLSSGVNVKCKINKKLWRNDGELKKNDIIYIHSMEKKFGWVKVGEKTLENGKIKPIFEEDKDKQEWWITNYSVIHNIDEIVSEYEVADER